MVDFYTKHQVLILFFGIGLFNVAYTVLLDLIRKEKIKFGRNLFYSICISLSLVTLMVGKILYGTILIIFSIVFSGITYDILMGYNSKVPEKNEET